MMSVLLFVISYLLGSIPFGLLVTRWWARIDIRKYGSGNIGMSNVLRTVGYVPGFFTLLLDGGKGFISVLLAKQVFDSPVLWLLCGLMAIIGHNWPVFLKFRGGKGVATTAGVMLGVSYVAAGILLAIWMVVVLVSRYISLGSLVTALSLPIVLLLLDFPWQALLLGVLITFFTLVRHRQNIQRLFSGTEYRVGEKGRPN